VTTSCAACGQANPSGARFCLACGTPLAAEAAARPTEERRVVTALFTDIVGSTASAEELDPEDVQARLAPYFARVRRELERIGGTVEKFIGDAVVAIFGAPQAHEDDPERAVRAALAIRAALEELNEEDPWLDLHVRVGVATGESLVTLGADPRSGQGFASGDVMNTAARIQSAAPADGVLVDEKTYEATADAIEYLSAEPLSAKGKSEPVTVWKAVAVRTDPGRRMPSRAPFVGRQLELETLAGIWSGVRDRRRRALLTITAQPGVGKSRLLQEFEVTSILDDEILRGRCLPYGEGITYWPVAEIVRLAASILRSDEAEVVSNKLGALVESLPTERPDELRTISAAVSNLVGAERTPAGTYSAAQISQAELHWGIRRLLELLAERRPTTVLFEDLHWAEDTLLELVRFLADGEAPVPLLIVATGRPEVTDRRPGLLSAGEGRHVLELEPFAPEESETLLLGIAAAARLSPETVETLVENSAGNPLFLEETVRMLAESESADGDAGVVAVPTSLQGLLGARLDRIPAHERAVAQDASVVGTVFWPGALAALDGGDGTTIADALAGLERRDVVHTQTPSTIEGELEYAFKHALIHDVAYARVPKRRRVPLHCRFAGWLEELPGGREEYVELVAYHLEQACRAAGEIAHSPEPPPVERAVQALALAADKAERREGFREADAFFARAIDVLGDADAEAALPLRLRRARISAAVGELTGAHAELADVSDAALELGRLDCRCAALVALANIDTKQGRAAESRRNLTEAIAIAEQIGDRHLQVRALYEFAYFAAWFEGAIEASADQLREAIEIAEALDDPILAVEGHMRLGTLCFNVGDLAGAEAAYRRCSELASELGSFRDEARSITLLGLVLYYRGEVDEAERLALQALDWLERTSDLYLQLQNLRELARYALARADLQGAEARLRKALPLALEVGGWLVIEIYRYLVETLVRQGRTEEAHELVEFAARNLPPEDAYAQAALCLAQASVATADGERVGAVARFDEALSLLREQRLLTDLGEARIAFARALRSFGDQDDAQAELERAREEFARMDAREIVAQIDRELAEAVAGADGAGPLP
jgi:class 3 adenylate cyclase/tetratricopeptide (TPR) repeat protein